VVLPRVQPAEPCTHQFQLWLPYPAEELDAAGLRMAEESGESLFGLYRFHEPGPPGLSMMEITVAESALDWTEADNRAAAARFARHLG
jgi:hypothetical protein